jgi:hypothetical protein
MGFGFVARFSRNPGSPGTPTGEVQFRLLSAGFEFATTALSSIVVSGATFRLTGTGKITGDPVNCTFLISCVDGSVAGGGSDRLRLRVRHGNNGTVIYDTQPGAADASDPTLNVGNSANILLGYTGIVTTTAVPDEPELPVAFALDQSAPNPAPGVCRIRYALPAPSRVRLTLFDVTGREVARIEDGERGAGVWSARVDHPELSGGVYFYRIEANRLDGRGARFTQTRRMLLLR